MTRARRGGRRCGGRRALVALLCALLAVALPACAAIDAMLDTERALEDAGYEDASVFWHSQNGVETLSIEWTARAETTDGLVAETRGAAQVAWENAPVRIDELRATALRRNGEPAWSVTYTNLELARSFGPRRPELDQDAGDFFGGVPVVETLLVLAGAGVLLTGLVVVALVRGRRRKEAPQWPGPVGPPGSGWPQASQAGQPSWSVHGGWAPYVPPGGGWPPGPPGSPPPGPPGPPPPAPPPGAGWPPAPPAPPPPGAPPGPPPAPPPPGAPPAPPPAPPPGAPPAQPWSAPPS